jgi:hypothetical protein
LTPIGEKKPLTLCRHALLNLAVLAMMSFAGIDSILADTRPLTGAREYRPAHAQSHVTHVIAGDDMPGTTALSSLDEAIALLLRYSPNKQINPQTGAGNPAIGKTPATACEVVRLFALVLVDDGSRDDARAKLAFLSDWVVRLQEKRTETPWYGGVPSTPDLPGVAARYFYSIDAALCGQAMFAAYEATQQSKYLVSAIRFADFLVAMHVGLSVNVPKASPAGFCEFVVAGSTPAWNCDTYVKSLLALPVLAQAALVSHQDRYARVASEARAFLVPGLEGAWEYATHDVARHCRKRPCRVTWRRIAGPHNEPDWFVYGDTLAYGIRGLFDYEGPSVTVRALYGEFSTYYGQATSTGAYDGRIAFAGYMRPGIRAPDEASAYYDLVTLGILHKVRQVIAPADFLIADHQLRTQALAAAGRSWKLGFDLRSQTEAYIDLTTITSLAEAYLLAKRESK